MLAYDEKRFLFSLSLKLSKIEGEVDLCKEYLYRFQGTVTVFIMTQMYKYFFSLGQISSCYIRQRQIDNRRTTSRDALLHQFCMDGPPIAICYLKFL